jgi:hypothetical protein
MDRYQSKFELEESVFDIPVYYSRLEWILKSAGIDETILASHKRDIYQIIKDAYDFGKKTGKISNY